MIDKKEREGKGREGKGKEEKGRDLVIVRQCFEGICREGCTERLAQVEA